MSLSPIPRGLYPSVTDISPQLLAAKGIRLVLADLDNTLVAYRVTEPPAELMAWKAALEAAGIRLFPTAASLAGRKILRRSWASPTRGTRASRGGRAISGPWSAWGPGRRRPSWWGIRSLPTRWGPTTRG